MYKLASLLITTLTFISGLRVLAQTTSLAYDNAYDNADLSLDQVACSGGRNGLESEGYTTLGSLPNFPDVGAFEAVTGWNSTGCGTCYSVTYGSNTLNILAVDVSKSGFTVSQAAMDSLTNNQASTLGSAEVSYVQTSPSNCGL